MSEPSLVPDLSQFVTACEEAFAFLLDRGFRRVPAPRSANRFQVWYSNGKLSAVISGEGHGTAASVYLETADRRVAEIYFTPANLRPTRTSQGVAEPSQLQQLREAALRVQRHCGDVLSGELTRFDALAEPLPAYLRAQRPG